MAGLISHSQRPQAHMLLLGVLEPEGIRGPLVHVVGGPLGLEVEEQQHR